MIQGERRYDKDPAYIRFRRQLFHRSLSFILSCLKPGTSTPQILRCPDGHYRRAIYCLGPYIADYPEQVLLTGIVSGWCPKCVAIFLRYLNGLIEHPNRCLAKNKDLDHGDHPERTCAFNNILSETFGATTLHEEFGIHGDTVVRSSTSYIVQCVYTNTRCWQLFTDDFPRADIHEMIAPDLLHQVIKGTFKDHLVTWVGEYLKKTKGSESAANAVIDEIDRRCAQNSRVLE